MTQNQVYGTQNTVAESAARNQHSYQNIVVQENLQDQIHQEARQHGAPICMAVGETSDDRIEMTQISNQVYRVPLASGARHDSITMEANVGYGVTGSHQERPPRNKGDEYMYEYIFDDTNYI